ncbi:MAG TPA: protein kinase, partial [Lacunisphaera sp.]|nr:protein kinase [Lacunisphaera sp.]
IPANAPLGACPHCLLAAGLASEPAAPTDSPPPPAPAQLAPEFPELEILELLGHGGMGSVYKARQRSLDRLVALKVLRPGLDADPSFAERFAREARALAQLNHPGIVTLYEFGRTPGGRYFILMEFVDGVNLRQLLAAGRLAPREALAIVPPLCDALQYAHDRGLIHRDIKPENILVDRLGRVKIADFGLAKLAAPTLPSEPHSAASGNQPAGAPGPAPAFALTEHGKVMGTPRYMAPEQRDRPDAVDHRADIYALGVVLYQMLTGELPDARQLQPPSHRVKIDVRLDEIVLRALEADPARRYQHASLLKSGVETVTAAAPAAKVPADNPAAAGSRPTIPYLLLGALAVLYLGWVTYSAGGLPDRVASHFSVDGLADGGMPRRNYLVFIAVFPLLLVGFLQGVARLTRRLPANLANLPHRDFWLAPERRADTAALLGRWLAGLSCVLLALFAQIAAAVVLANERQPARLPDGAFFASIMGFAGGMMLWLVGMLLRFAEPQAPARVVRWRTRAVAVMSLVAVAAGAIPLVKAWRNPNRAAAAASRTTSSLPAMTTTQAIETPTNSPNVAAPAATATTPDETQRKIIQLKLDQARRELDLVRAKHDAGMGTGAELLEAQDRVAIFEAELAGDTSAAPRIQLASARLLLADAQARRDTGMATELDVDAARTKVAILEAEVQGQPGLAARVTQLKLEQARRALPLIEERFNAGIIDFAELQTARDTVDLLEAELTHDPVAVARAKLASAERRLEPALARAMTGTGTYAEVDEARTKAAILQLEYKALAPAPAGPPVTELPLQSTQTTPRLQFRAVHTVPDASTESLRFSQGGRDEALHLSRWVLLSEDAVAEAVPQPGTDQARSSILLKFTPAGASQFEQITGALAGRRLAILLDGRVVSRTNILQAITGSTAQISGTFTAAEATAMAAAIQEAVKPPPAPAPELRLVIREDRYLIDSQLVSLEQLGERLADF